MTNIAQPLTVDPLTGDIIVHGREGIYLTLQFKLADGSARDVSAASLWFEVEGLLRIALGTTNLSDIRSLTVSRAQVLQLYGTARQFAFVDESGTVPDVFWRGEVRVEGFTDQPA